MDDPISSSDCMLIFLYHPILKRSCFYTVVITVVMSMCTSMYIFVRIPKGAKYTFFKNY